MITFLNTVNVSNTPIDLAQLRTQAITLYRAGDLDAARLLLEQVVAGAPDDWEAWNMLGALHGMQSSFAACEACCRQVITLQPAAFSTYNNLGNALKFQGKFTEARQAYDTALKINPHYPEALNNLGNLEREQGAPGTARALFLKALQLRPDYAQAHNNLGNTYRDEGDFEDAAIAYRKAVAANPGYPDALINLGIICQLQDNITEAIDCQQRALAIAPKSLNAMFNLGTALLIAGEVAQAEHCFTQVLALDPAHTGAGYFLSTIRGESVPEQSPRDLVINLFDSYAGTFDRHLVNDLGYSIPSQLFALYSDSAAPSRKLSILDLGCGTGLSGEAFRATACRMEGVDLSPRMIDKATARNIYDELHVADVLEIVSTRTRRYDLVVAADVFVYIGALANLFHAVRGVLNPDGCFCFSIERQDGEGAYSLRQSGRYAHSVVYIETLAGAVGFRPLAMRPTVIRNERGTPIQGNIFILQADE
jgi:predicted TPR repeat methyltransferase